MYNCSLNIVYINTQIIKSITIISLFFEQISVFCFKHSACIMSLFDIVY